jgi:putative transposase
MKKSRFTETQIVSILKEVDAGLKVEGICRQHGISNGTYYNWKSKYGDMEASDVQKLRDLQEENDKLKKMFANLSLENLALKDLIEKRVGDRRKTRSGHWLGGVRLIDHASLSGGVFRACKLLPNLAQLAYRGCGCH